MKEEPQLSILITAYREADTIGAALAAVCRQVDLASTELLVICPDQETADVARRYPGVTILNDPAQGKPAALNLGLQQANGKLIVLTDGDVLIDADAIRPLLAPFADPEVGAVSGRPISTSSRDRMLGYWSHLLTDAGAHLERLRRDRTGQFFVCSGYLYAIKAGLVSSIPLDALADDAVISHLIGEQGYRIRYAPDAHVRVKYPDNYRDWLTQKVRSAGGYAQPIIAQSALQMRSFWHELLNGTWPALAYPRSLRELLWTAALFAARLHLWTLIFWHVRIKRTPLPELWRRVESTK
ncbi:MAG: glycosyltransferase [Chloroflexi bacterium]|nr:glycosyltransferase [Chloroflexota bacterium]